MSDRSINSNLSLKLTDNYFSDLLLHYRSFSLMFNLNYTRMLVILEEISKDIAAGSIDTADFTTKLTAMVADLRNAVAEFKLPES